MLILTRKPGESLYIGDQVKITIVEVKGNQIRVGIEAPAALRIYREEIYVQILEENKKAAESGLASPADLGSFEGLRLKGKSSGGSGKSSLGSLTASKVTPKPVTEAGPAAAGTQQPGLVVTRKRKRNPGEEDDEQGDE